MSTVCSWFTFLCMRENNSQKPRKVHPNQSKYDAMVVWKGKADKPIKKSGSLAFEVILKPASNNSPLRPVSPPKSSRISLSEEDIKLKLQKAEERRQSLEAQRLEQLAKEREKAQEVLAKAAQESLQFSKATQEKLRRSMEANKENREAQIKALQERLREHSLKVQETCKQSDKMEAEYQEKINSKISQKFEVYEENRQTKLQSMRKRLRDHANHIQEVCQASENMGKVCEEKLVSKMENALRNREEQLKALQERLLEHERRIEEVQKKKGMKQEENEMGDA
ncbi:stathmin-2-like isoform X1 [Littorina saxatilis]|uniref:Stathmin n=1 Tax=Littorina saxatilis TaxID=31220 RepID=A0AAN9BA15_9CAEN